MCTFEAAALAFYSSLHVGYLIPPHPDLNIRSYLYVRNFYLKKKSVVFVFLNKRIVALSVNWSGQASSLPSVSLSPSLLLSFLSQICLLSCCK